MIEAQEEPRPQLWMVSILDRDVNGHPADLKQILAVLGEKATRLAWIVTVLDCMGPGTEQFCEAVEAARNNHSAILLSGLEMVALADSIVQTIDANIVAFEPVDANTQEALQVSRVGGFKGSVSRLVISVVDSSFYYVATKDEKDIQVLKQHFSHVEDLDPGEYL